MNDQSQPNFARALLGTAGMLLSHAAAGLVVLMVLFNVVPVCVRFFDDFEVALPAATQALIHLSMITTRHWHLLLPGFLFLGFAALALYLPFCRGTQKLV